MKIAMMTRWNVPSGQSAHAEPIGHAWQEMGHELKIFAPAGLDSHLIYRQDEPFVHRCYMQDFWGQRDRSDYFFDPRPFLEEDYDIFLVEMLYLMPIPELLEIFPEIKRKARTVLVVSEVGLPQDPDWYRFEWDAIVCFDARYKEFMARAFPRTKISIVPFPCHPPLHGDTLQARKTLALPQDKKIAFTYGFDIARMSIDLFPTMERLAKDYLLSFLVVSHHGIKPDSTPDFLLLRDEMPATERLYTYLHASDTYIYYIREGDFKQNGIGVSSSVATCLGAGRPILVPGHCNFFNLCGNEVIKFWNMDDLESKLRDIFEGAKYVKETLTAAEQYATQNSGPRIAAQFVQLFDELRVSYVR